VSVEPHPLYGHLKGLPLGINITSAVPARDMKYINVCDYYTVAVDVENGVCFSEDQLKIPFEDFNIKMEKPGTFCNSRVLNFTEVYASHFSSTVMVYQAFINTFVCVNHNFHPVHLNN